MAIPLHRDTNVEAITADLDNGVLEISVPKPVAITPRQIKIGDSAPALSEGPAEEAAVVAEDATEKQTVAVQ